VAVFRTFLHNEMDSERAGHAAGGFFNYKTRPMMRALFVWSLGLVMASLAAWASFAQEPAPAPDAGKIRVAATDWPWWRGPARNGIADATQQPPLKWSDRENILWKAAVPGRGHGSPTVVADRIFLATADHGQQTQSVLCYHRRTGKRLWHTEVHKGGFGKIGNVKGSHASATVACDGARVFVNFLNQGAVYTTALSVDGEQLWQKKITDFEVHMGFGSSPALYERLVLVSADNQGTGALAALDRLTGAEVWRRRRPATANYASPIVLNVAGRDQLFLTGCNLVASFEPLTGETLWEIKGSTTECVTSTVTDGKHIYTSGGYPRNHIAAVRADGSCKIAWENGTRIYVPSMVADRGYLYAVLDADFVTCLKCDTGKEMWKERLDGGISASLVLVGEHIYATNESGHTFIFKATPKELDVVAENQLGTEAMATPTICGGRIYMRVAAQENGRRQETLYCIGKGDQ
jgi:outer membrane protein assembly factor BamB